MFNKTVVIDKKAILYIEQKRKENNSLKIQSNND